jgi:hypothetical protein
VDYLRLGVDRSIYALLGAIRKTLKKVCHCPQSVLGAIKCQVSAVLHSSYARPSVGRAPFPVLLSIAFPTETGKWLQK